MLLAKQAWCTQALLMIAHATPLLLFRCMLQLMPETLYLTCNIIDRYLSIRNVTRKRLQLVGADAIVQLTRSRHSHCYMI
jgi:hypothetical protein